MSIFDPFDEQQYEAQAAETDALLARLSKPNPVQQPLQQQQADWSGWDRWAEAHIERALTKYTEELTEAMGEVISEIRRELRKEFAEQLGQLRCDIEILRAHKSGNVTPIKGDRDAA